MTHRNYTPQNLRPESIHQTQIKTVRDNSKTDQGLYRPSKNYYEVRYEPLDSENNLFNSEEGDRFHSNPRSSRQ